MLLAEKIRAERENAGLDAETCAAKAHVSVETLLEYETGTTKPDIFTFIRILQACGNYDTVDAMRYSKLCESYPIETPGVPSPVYHERYLVVETMDRELLETSVHLTLHDAVLRANELLKTRASAVDADEFASFRRAVETDPRANLTGDGIRLATEKNPEAYCNWGDGAWDAYVRRIEV